MRYWGKMAEFVGAPNLPKCADTVILGAKYAEKLKKALKKLEITPLFVPDNPNVERRLSGHADLSLIHAGGDRVFLAPYLNGTAFAQTIINLGADVNFAGIRQSAEYPFDAQLNLVAVVNNLICNTKTAYLPAVDYLSRVRGMNVIDCRQGYTKCSVLVVDEHSIITQDKGISSAAKKAGLDVLEIESGYVMLDGYDYGFIGGAGFKLSSDTLAFTGTFDAHPDKMRILDFIASHGVNALYLTDEPIFDIGSAIPLTEKINPTDY